MVLGILVGTACHHAFPDPATAAAISDKISLLTTIFLRLIKMIIAPLVFSTLVVGVSHLGDTSTIGRIGIKSLGWFISASLCSLLLGMLMANILAPGENIGLSMVNDSHGPDVKATALSFKEVIIHMVPASIAEAMANNEILQIVVFSIFFGASLATLGEKGKPLADIIDQVAQVMLKITGAVMVMAPVAVFAAMAATITTQGLGILATFAKFMLGFYFSLALLWGLLILVGFVFLGRRIQELVVLIKEPFLISFSTASSEAAYPPMLNALDRFGVDRKISSFVLPLGYSFNLDGSMMYCTFAVLFIAQAYDLHLSLATQLSMLLLLMVTSKGMAGVPRASLVVIAATLQQFQIPEAGLLLIMGVDQFLDMGRSATNAVGNSVATAVIAHWEGGLRDESMPEPIPVENDEFSA
jgi:Na+/H+-dicarboxylate symporter